MALWTTRVRRKPYASSLGTVKASFTINRTVYNLRSLTGQLIPAHAIDALAKVTNRKSPGLAQIIRKQFAKMETLDFFLTREFAFAVDNSKALWGRMAPADRLLFPYADIAAMDWGKYLEVVLEGSKTYLLRENPTRQEAKFCCRSRMEESPNKFRIDRLLPLLAMPMLAVTAGPAMCIENLQYHWTRVCGQSGESLFRVERVLPLLALPVILVTAGPLLCLDMIQSNWSDIEALIVAAKQFLWDRKYNLACFVGFILGLVKFFL